MWETGRSPGNREGTHSPGRSLRWVTTAAFSLSTEQAGADRIPSNCLAHRPPLGAHRFPSTCRLMVRTTPCLPRESVGPSRVAPSSVKARPLHAENTMKERWMGGRHSPLLPKRECLGKRAHIEVTECRVGYFWGAWPRRRTLQGEQWSRAQRTGPLGAREHHSPRHHYGSAGPATSIPKRSTASIMRWRDRRRRMKNSCRCPEPLHLALHAVSPSPIRSTLHKGIT